MTGRDELAGRAALRGVDEDAAAGTPSRTPAKVLLRSSWQTVNIGDIAHTPGMLALLERHWSEAGIRLWLNARASAARERDFAIVEALAACV